MRFEPIIPVIKKQKAEQPLTLTLADPVKRIAMATTTSFVLLFITC